MLTKLFFTLKRSLQKNIWSKLKVYIVFDNKAKEGFKKGWGLSLYIETDEKNILFDTGCSGEDLIFNLDKFNIDFAAFSDVVISHAHWDHTGGIFSLLNRGGAYNFFVGESFSKKFSFEIEERRGRVIRGNEWRKISENFYITPELKENFPEQALAYNAKDFSFLFLGCSHPKVEEFAKLTFKKFNNPLYIMGGFHFYPLSNEEIEFRLNELKKTPILKIYPLHCTGDRGRELVLRKFEGENLKAGDTVKI